MLYNCLKNKPEKPRNTWHWAHFCASWILLVCSCSQYVSHCDMFSDSISCSWDKLIIDGRPSPITPAKHLGSIFCPDQLEIWVDALDVCSGVEPGTPSDETQHVFLITVTPVVFIIHAAAAAAKLLQSCPTLCDPIDGSPPGSPVPGILQARVLEHTDE